jgi:hypothetical protein
LHLDSFGGNRHASTGWIEELPDVYRGAPSPEATVSADFLCFVIMTPGQLMSHKIGSVFIPISIFYECLVDSSLTESQPHDIVKVTLPLRTGAN